MKFKIKRNPLRHKNVTEGLKQRGRLSKAASHIRHVSFIFGILLTLTLALIGICAFGIHWDNYATLNAGLPKWSIGNKSERVLIFSPHCDDETLACAGLISRLRTRGIPVKVVFATNGDAFRIACVRQFNEINVKPKHFIQFGYIREKETLNALHNLGLTDKDVIFLGYPDRGLSKMWLENWDESNLVKSAYTNSDHSPYSTSYQQHAPYCGESLLGNLESILRDFKPTTVYYPHTYEQHPDHWAASCFMTQALYETGLTDKVRAGLYVVHRGDWPVPQGIHLERSMPPPAALKDLGTRWYEFDLSQGGEAQKLDTINRYKTQTTIMGRFLRSFARTNELFGLYPPVSMKAMKIDGNVSDLHWNMIQPSILDPIGDNINVDVGRNGDIKEIRCCHDDKNIYVRLGLAHEFSSATWYNIHLHVLPNPGIEPINLSVKGNYCNNSRVRVTTGPNALQIVIPQSMLGKWDALMLSSDSIYKRITLDKTAWRIIRREDSALSLRK